MMFPVGDAKKYVILAEKKRFVAQFPIKTSAMPFTHVPVHLTIQIVLASLNKITLCRQ